MKRGIVVYGSGPQDTDELTPVERLNIGAAVKVFCQRKGKATFILTGGKSGKSPLSEAEVMARRLIYLKIPEKCILLEDKATNTIENVVSVTNLVDRMSFKWLFHIAPQVHLPRVKELCYLIGIDGISECKSSEEILGDNDPRVKSATEALSSTAENEPKWMRGLKEVPLYWLPQVARLESFWRWHYVLCRPRLVVFLKERFGITKPENLTEDQLKNLRKVIKKERRIMP